MSDVSLRMEHVFKKFSRGERHDSLRDLVPAMTRRLFRRALGNGGLRPEEFWALNDVSFEVRKGEALGIIGHNGAGKSTILKHLSGIMRPTTGSVVVQGRLSALIEVGAGFHQDLTGRENVFLNGVILGMSRAEIRRKFDEIVEFSGIADFIDMPVKRYSSGMYARLGFSVAAHMEPDILIVDEVLSVGDYAFQSKSVEKMRSILRGGATVIFVSHNLRAMADMCARSLLLRRGQIVEDGPTPHVIRTYMEQIREARKLDTERDVVIESVDVRAVDGPRLNFRSGETAIVDVTIRAVRPIAKLSCDLYLMDEEFYGAFNTSTDRLGEPLLTLRAGERHTYRFEVDLHLAAGNFYLCVALYRYDINRVYDRVEPAATLLVNTQTDVRGIVNLDPRVTRSESLPPAAD